MEVVLVELLAEVHVGVHVVTEVEDVPVDADALAVAVSTLDKLPCLNSGARRLA